MKLFAIAALSAALLGCAGNDAVSLTHTPTKPAIVAMTQPPTTLAPVQASTRTLDHKFWSLTVPTKDWEVTDDTEEGVRVVRTDPETGKQTAYIQVVSQDLNEGTPVEAYPMIMSMLAPSQVPDGVEVTSVERHSGRLDGHHASVTQVATDHGIFMGVVAIVDEANKKGYAVICIAPMKVADGKLMSEITQTFTLKTAAPQDDDSTPPVTAPKKGTAPIHPTKTNYEL